jgi:hypothetical protein
MQLLEYAVVCGVVLQDPTSALQQLLKSMPDGGAPKATYVKGDRVVVVAGDLNTLAGESAAVAVLRLVV